MLETKDPLNCLSVEDGARSKRNFHRPESNCGIAVISACEVFRLGSSAIGFVFMHYAQAFEERHFRKFTISFAIPGAVAGKSSHTSKFRPWKLKTYIAFTDRAKAGAFERYLKSGSGHSFAPKHLW